MYIYIVAAVATTKVLCISRKLQYHVASGKGLVSLPRLWHLARFARTDRVCLPSPKIDQAGLVKTKFRRSSVGQSDRSIQATHIHSRLHPNCAVHRSSWTTNLGFGI